jgi:hypothetical protein
LLLQLLLLLPVQGMEIIKQAVIADNEDQLEQALSLYRQGLGYFMTGQRHAAHITHDAFPCPAPQPSAVSTFSRNKLLTRASCCMFALRTAVCLCV